MSRKTLLGLFLVVAAAQVAVPASMIAQRESVLGAGHLFKFRVEPVDPYDAFRGRYVALRLAEDSGPATPGMKWLRGQTVYAQLVEDSQGFAHISVVTPWKPDNPDYIAVRVRYADNDRVNVTIPLDRYYMNEAQAPEAERAYREHARASVGDVYAAVRVRNGMGVIEELYIGSVPIEEYLRQHASE